LIQGIRVRSKTATTPYWSGQLAVTDSSFVFVFSYFQLFGRIVKLATLVGSYRMPNFPERKPRLLQQLYGL
jgi:hypothetical protein